MREKIIRLGFGVLLAGVLLEITGYPSMASAIPQSNEQAKVVSITGPTSLTLENGDKLSLDLVSVPTALGEKAAWANKRNQERAQERLAALTKGKVVTILSKSPSKDRYGNFKVSLGLVTRQDVAGIMISEGLVALRHPQKPHPKWQEYLDLEDQARASKKGIWRERALAPACEDEANFKASRYAIIAGDIEAISIQREVIYVNFTDNWREDFTVRLKGRGRKRLFEGLKDKLQAGAWVEVRGWVSWTNGPLIDVTSPLQVRALKAKPDFCPPLKE